MQAPKGHAATPLPSSHDIFRQFARPSKATSPQDISALRALLEVTKVQLGLGLTALVKEAAHRPLLISYASDCTPTVSTHRNSFQLPGHKAVKRSGRGCDEYLVQVLFAAYLCGDERKAVAKISEPLPLNCGKSAVALWTCAKDFCVQPLLDMGHQGICIHHYSWDRACFSSQASLVRQWHTHSLRSSSVCAEGMPKKLMFLLTWVPCTACSEHGCHKAQEWAMHASFKDVDLLKRLHVAVESLRDSYPQIMRLLPRLVSEIQVLPMDMCMSDQHLTDIWQLLGVDADLCSDLVSLRLICVHGRLQATMDVVSEEPFASRCYYCLAALWKFTKFSSGRWLSVGSACKGIARATLSGIDRAVQLVQDDAVESSFFINGWSDLGADGREFSFVAPMAAGPCDVLLQELLQDNRVAAKLDFLEAAALEAMDKLAKLPEHVWKVFEQATGKAALFLKSSAIHSAHVSLAFVSMRVFDGARQLPWSLARGNVDDNPSELQGGECPEEAVSAKVWHLLHMGWNVEDIKAGLRTLLECGWATDCVERQHSSLTVMKRFHPDAGQETLVVRAGTHSLRLLLPLTSAEDEKESRLRARLEKLGSKQPQKHQGRQQLAKELVDLTSLQKRPASFTSASGKVQRAIFKKHSETWERLPEAHKQTLHDAAALHRASSRDKIDEEIESTRAALAEVRDLKALGGPGRKPLCLGVCNLTSPQFACIDEALQNAQLSPGVVEQMRAKARTSPQPDTAAVAAMSDIVLGGSESAESKPSWLGTAAQHRDHFAETARAVSGVFGTRYFKFMFAFQRPLMIRFSPLCLDDGDGMEILRVDAGNWETFCLEQPCVHKFKAQYGVSLPWTELPSLHIGSIQVMFGLRHLGGDQVASNGTWEPLKAVLARLPAKAANARSKGSGTTRTEKEKLLSKFPWLECTLNPQEPRLTKHGGSQGSALGSQDMVEADDVDFDLDQVFDDLRSRREALGMDQVLPADF